MVRKLWKKNNKLLLLPSDAMKLMSGEECCACPPSDFCNFVSGFSTDIWDTSDWIFTDSPPAGCISRGFFGRVAHGNGTAISKVSGTQAEVSATIKLCQTTNDTVIVYLAYEDSSNYLAAKLEHTGSGSVLSLIVDGTTELTISPLAGAYDILLVCYDGYKLTAWAGSSSTGFWYGDDLQQITGIENRAGRKVGFYVNYSVEDTYVGSFQANYVETDSLPNCVECPDKAYDTNPCPGLCAPSTQPLEILIELENAQDLGCSGAGNLNGTFGALYKDIFDPDFSVSCVGSRTGCIYQYIQRDRLVLCTAADCGFSPFLFGSVDINESILRNITLFIKSTNYLGISAPAGKIYVTIQVCVTANAGEFGPPGPGLRTIIFEKLIDVGTNCLELFNDLDVPYVAGGLTCGGVTYPANAPNISCHLRL